MRKLLVGLVMVGALAALAGCGQETRPGTAPTSTTSASGESNKQEAPGSPPSTGQSPSAPVTRPSPAVLPAGVALVPATQVDATGLPLEYKRHKDVWVFEDGHALQMFAMATNGCAGVQAKLVDQTADAVRITLSALDSPQGGPADGACTQALEPKPVTVRLDEALGERMVYLLSGR